MAEATDQVGRHQTTELSAIRNDLIVLHKAASATDGWDGKQARTFIDVGEYGLALDEIAYAYLDSGKAMPTGHVRYVRETGDHDGPGARR